MPRLGGAIGFAGGTAIPELATVSGALPGSTTTRVPTCTRLYKSSMSSLSSRMQPDDTNWPMVEGWLVPWMRYSVLPR